MISKTTCTACGACVQICPKKSIQFVKNKNGHLFPKIDKDRCINCNLCRTICPQNNPPEFFMPKECYVAWSQNINDQTYSASGGIGASFARYCIKNGDYVYGCDYNSLGDLKHFRLINEDDISKSQSSKYSQSNAYACFYDIRDQLNSNQKVLFIGTPCQIAGLKNFLRKTFDNLITVDLICHGTPPNVFFKEHLTSLNIPLPIDRIRFRGEYDQALTIWKNGSIIYQKNNKDDLYFKAFYDNMISYDSCFYCKYATSKRISDITIGDFWGLGELKQIDRISSRPSIILINTKNGIDFFDLLKSDLLIEKRDLIEGIKGNGRLNTSPGKNRKAKCFQFFYALHFGFKKSVTISNRLNTCVDCLGAKLSIIKDFFASVISLTRRVFSILKNDGIKALYLKIKNKFKKDKNDT